MTPPRIVQPGDTVFMTVRTIQRCYLLKPDPTVTASIKYLLAHYSAVHDIALHAACVMSTHMHVVYTDNSANGPHFLRDLHAGIARVVQARYGVDGGVFAQRPNQLRLQSTGAIIDKIAYTLGNPVSSCAVKAAHHWTGLRFGHHPTPDNGLEVGRPANFSKHGRFPPKATLRVDLPHKLIHAFGMAGAIRQLRLACEACERKARRALELAGVRFLGRTRAEKIDPLRRATTVEARTITPTFATKGDSHAAHQRAIEQLRSFRRAYAAALERLRNGVRNVVFPYGTFLLRFSLRVMCAGPPTHGVRRSAVDAPDCQAATLEGTCSPGRNGMEAVAAAG